MKTFKKSRLSILSTLLLLAACGGGGGEFSGNSDLPSNNSPGAILPIPGKTPAPGGGEGNPGGGNPGGGDPVSGNPGGDPGGNPGGDPGGDLPPPIITVPLTPIFDALPQTRDTGITEFGFLVFSDMHVGFSSSEKKQEMAFEPTEYSADDHDLDSITFDGFLTIMKNSWAEIGKTKPGETTIGSGVIERTVTCDPLTVCENKSEGMGNVERNIERKVVEPEGTGTKKFALLIGDTASHTGTENRFNNLYKAKEQMKRLDVPILDTLGNNDSAVDHYGPHHPKKNYLDVTSKAGWLNAYLSTGVACGRTFFVYPCIRSESPNGYYSAYLEHKLKLISVESVMFADSNYYSDEYKKPEFANVDEQQFAWLERQLLESREVGDSVMIAMHIQPSNWKNNFQRAVNPKTRLNNAIAISPSTVIGIFVGHSHDDQTEKYSVEYMVKDKNGKDKKQTWHIPQFTIIGLSTSHGNAPGFRHISMTRTNLAPPKQGVEWAVKDAMTYVFRPGPAEFTLLPPPKDPRDDQKAIKRGTAFLNLFYSYNNTFCPSGTKSTLSSCLRNKENYSKDPEELEKGGNPNCFTYSGRCVPKGGFPVDPIDPPPVDPPVGVE